MESLNLHIINSPSERSFTRDPELAIIASGDEADVDGELNTRSSSRLDRVVNFDATTMAGGKKKSRTRKRRHRKQHQKSGEIENHGTEATMKQNNHPKSAAQTGTQTRLTAGLDPSGDGVLTGNHERTSAHQQTSKRPFGIRNIALRPPVLKTSSTIESPPTRFSALVSGTPPSSRLAAPYVVRRATSLPDRLNQQHAAVATTADMAQPQVKPVNVPPISLEREDGASKKKYISPKTAIILLLISTGLVAVCAEFLVGSINELVEDTSMSEAFIGLIILPMVSNAAEHVTAVVVAAKNKMDLAIAVALGSSIQIGESSPF